MKTRHRLLPLWAISITFSAVGICGNAQAATIQYWNAGGDGNWGTSPGDKNWNVVISGPLPSNTVWPDTGNEVAAFQDASGGTVTVFDPVQTAGIIQHGANYSINAGTITLVQDLAMVHPFIDVQTGTLTIDSTLDGTKGLIKNGTGNLVLSTANTYTGTTTLNAGTLTLLGSLVSDALDIAANAVLLDQSGGLANGTVLTNAGTLTMGASDTISTYISNGGTLAAGAGTLTAATYNLNDGTSVTGHLGSGTLNSNGAVSISGTAAALTVNVQTGMLTLGGNNLADAATVNLSNGATLSLGAADTIGTLNSNGIIAGAGTLTAATYNLSDGTSVTGHLGPGALNSNGAVSISGTAAALTVNVQTGMLTLGGNNLADAATVNLSNGATLSLGAADTIGTLNSNGIIAGAGTLTAATYNLNDGTSVTGHLGPGALNSNGAVSITGTASATNTHLDSGTLTLLGNLVTATLDIATNASLLDQSGGLVTGTVLTNGGMLAMGASDTIAAYISNAGTLAAGPGTLTATTANLYNGSSVIGQLAATTLISNGAVSISGTATAADIHVASGNLTNTGVLGSPVTHLDIAAGATLTASGTQHYALLTTSGSGPGTWLGNLANPATIAPGGVGTTGTLRVEGSFTNTPGGVLKIDVAAAAHDLIDVQGSVTWGGTLELNQFGSAPIAPFVPIQVVAANSYFGNITTLAGNLDSAVWFNPGNGSVMLLAESAGSGGKLFGSTSNHTSTWIALYDDVIAPGVVNIIHNPGGSPAYQITGGIADANNPDLLWALNASFTPAGLDANLLNRLSPEVYVGFQDYAVQATRTHQRTALSAPALVSSENTGSMTDSKESGKNALPGKPANHEWEIFAATDYFNVRTTNSANQADYQLSGQGIIAGLRTMATDRLKVAAYFAGDVGKVDGTLIDADATGWSLGLLGDYLLEEQSGTHLTAGLSYGGYAFNGTRGSASATSSGWAPGPVHFHDVNSDSLELFLGMESVVYHNDRFRLTPSLGLRYATGTMDSFTETTGKSPGSPIALAVNHDPYHAALAEIALLAEAEVTNQLTLWTQLGANRGLGGQPPAITGRFASGSRSMRAEADGLSNDLWFVGVGANYKISDSISVGIGYRSDFRAGADNQNSVYLSSVFRF